MKVLIIGAKNPPETFLTRLIDGLSKRNYKTILGLINKPDGQRYSKNNTWIWLPSWNISTRKRVSNILLFLIKPSSWKIKELLLIIKIVKQRKNLKSKIHQFYLLLPLINKKFDVVYFPWILTADLYIDYFNELNIPLVVSLRGSMINIDPFIKPDNETVKKRLEYIFNNSQAIHCVSEDIFETAQQFKLDKSKVVIIKPAVDFNFFFQKDIKECSKFRIVSTGSLIWIKGYEYALISIKKLIDQNIDCEYHIIGEGPERQRILYTIQDLGIEKCVFMHGNFCPERVRDQLQTSDVFLLSSLSEGISNAALEAMACGLPVIATNTGGIKEIIDNGENGFLFDPEDTIDLTNIIIELSNDNNLYKNIVKKGKEKIEKNFTLSIEINNWYRLYKEILN